MEEVKEITNFFSAIQEDHRIGISHISVYMALFQFYNLNQFRNPVNITRAAVMQVAKISGLATYHKCMRDLAEFGYIEYRPSYNPSISTQIHILKQFLPTHP
jgi:hypothetical protein